LVQSLSEENRRQPLKRWLPTERDRPLSGFAVLRVAVAIGAELLEVQAIRVVTPVLLGDVVAVFTHRARHRDLRSNVSGLGHGSTFFVS
jgi:hypothetical protein